MTPTTGPLRPSLLSKVLGLAIAALLVAGFLAHAAAPSDPAASAARPE